MDEITEWDLNNLRLKVCVEAWPDCHDGRYDPRCCRFPKQCSPHGYIEQFQEGTLTRSDLEDPSQRELSPILQEFFFGSINDTTEPAPEEFIPPIHISTLSDAVFDAIMNADCYCKPGDPTCEDWRNSDHRWHTIHRAVMNVIGKEEIPEQSNLVDHARRELELIGEDPEFIEHYIKVIRAFAECGHSGGSASIAIPVINALLRFKPLGPLTNNPNEWMKIDAAIWGHSEGIWQCKRNPEAFSNDGGKTYYLLSEGGSDKNREPMHTSEEF